MFDNIIDIENAISTNEKQIELEYQKRNPDFVKISELEEEIDFLMLKIDNFIG